MNKPDNDTLLLYQIALTELNGIGPVRARHFLAKTENIEDIFLLSPKKLSFLTGMDIQFIKNLNREKALIFAEQELKNIQRDNFHTYFYTDKKYPRRLKQCSDAPLLLYGKGNLELNETKYVAIVGTRNATEYGKSLCEELVMNLAGKNITVVSGMAYGIDICIHNLCLKYNVPTIGVLGHGLDRLYPYKHRGTAQKMEQMGGLLTEYPTGTNPDRENFPMRNRIVAGLCDATIVVESKESGGSLITADLANDYSRDVFAYPGNVHQPYSKGCNQLIAKQKAHLITNSTDFLTWMNWHEENNKSLQTQMFISLKPEERQIIDLLMEEGEHQIDLISIKTKLPISQTNVLLFNLEMAGAIKSLPGKRFKVCENLNY